MTDNSCIIEMEDTDRSVGSSEVDSFLGESLSGLYGGHGDSKKRMHELRLDDIVEKSPELRVRGHNRLGRFNQSTPSRRMSMVKSKISFNYIQKEGEQ